MELLYDEIDYFDNNDLHGKSVEHKVKITRTIPAQPPRPLLPPQNPDGTQPPQPPQPQQLPVSALNVEVTIPLKYLSNFWRSLDLPSINCEVELNLI